MHFFIRQSVYIIEISVPHTTHMYSVQYFLNEIILKLFDNGIKLMGMRVGSRICVHILKNTAYGVQN
jgi:hypothetical protein